MFFVSKSPSQTKKFALGLAKKARGGEILALEGGLGGGKTFFTKWFARGLGIKNTITSPSFLLMKIYRVKQNNINNFCHADVYRLKAPVEIIQLGLKEYLGKKDTITVIEWADKIKNILRPYKTTTLRFRFVDKNTRKITIKKPRLK